jgi:uncharacterized protein
MNKLFQFSVSRINSVNTGFKRYLWKSVNWHNRLIAITGSRGVGKTTFLLQYIREHLNNTPDEVIYVNLDDLYFSKNSLVDFAQDFVNRGGKYLFLDEVHKYQNWSQELKNIYDYFPGLKIVVTGSSALNIYRGNADLSRRAVLYKMKGLSFREYIAMRYQAEFPAYKLEDLLYNSGKIIPGILEKVKPIRLFEEYLQYGYYPFFAEGVEDFSTRLKQTVNHVLDNDIPSVEKVDYNAVHNLRKLLSILSEIVPYKPNILKLSRQVGISRETLIRYLNLLEKADLTMSLQSDTRGISRLNKPEKIYLNNPNLVYSLADAEVNQETLRETFFINQFQGAYTIRGAEKVDFIVNDKYSFEVGRKNKKHIQLSGLTNSYIAADNIEFAVQNKIPLWLFGFLY